MNIIEKLLLSVFLIFYTSCIKASTESNPFTTIFPSEYQKNINRIISKTDSIIIPDNWGSILGLSIDCDILQCSKSSFIRVILEDSAGKSYLVMEVNRLRNNNDTIVLSNYCEETAFLNNVYPVKLNFYIKDASVNIKNINYVKNTNGRSVNMAKCDVDSLKRKQVSQIVDQINEYNRKHDKLWAAGITEVALMDFDTKKRVLGLIDNGYDTGGIEYYIGGVYEVGEKKDIASMSTRELSSPYVDSFDWRNRHGRNWITSVKNQGQSGYCVAFAINGMLEARANLFYNRNLNMDLSEQDIVFSYSKYTNQDIGYIYNKGMNTMRALGYVVKDGVLDEATVPFIDSKNIQLPEERPESDSCLFITSQKHLSKPGNYIDEVKRILINNGPVASGFVTNPYYDSVENQQVMGHAMTLVGYHTLQAGDTIHQVKVYSDGGLFSPIVISKGDSRIGQTYWIFKDNYGTEYEDKINGYLYVLFNNYDCMYSVDYTESPIICNLYSEDDIMCTDNDGDGFYFWGIGPKPKSLPDWVPDTPDGDDSDYSKGPMDEYGFLHDLDPNINDTIYIEKDTTYLSQCFLYNHIFVKNGATLTFSNVISFYKNVTLTIDKGGTLIVDGGTLNDAIINVNEGGTVNVINNGCINLCKSKSFVVPLGSTMLFEEGRIISQK